MVIGVGWYVFGDFVVVEQCFVLGYQVWIGYVDVYFLVGEVGGDVGQVLVVEVGQQVGYFQYGMFVVFDVMYLFEQVMFVLVGQFWEVWCWVVVICIVIGVVYCGFCLVCGGIVSGMGKVGQIQG